MGQAARESFRVRRIGRREHGRPRGNALLCQAAMHIGRRQEASPHTTSPPQQPRLPLGSRVSPT